MADKSDFYDSEDHRGFSNDIFRNSQKLYRDNRRLTLKCAKHSLLAEHINSGNVRGLVWKHSVDRILLCYHLISRAVS